MTSLWKSIKLVLEKPRVDSAKKLQNGDILLVSTDTDTMRAIKNMSGKDGFNVIEEGNRKPKVKIKNVPADYSAEFIADAIMDQNPNLKPESKDDVKPLFKCGPRNRQVVDWVVEVSPKVYSAMLNKRTFIGLISTFPRPFVSAPHCRRCLAVDHTTKNCTNDIKCHHCATTGHDKEKCNNKGDAPTCAHCGGRHTTMGKECKTWAKRIIAVQRITDYGTQPTPSNND
ncbi:CCHC-type domain-containing protein [Aphis craccivora]|uniref:CCHC-type domain-containing protein n=1 Tax=Aphis craccivora TaxID=307492 RepID=A0A6G0Y1A7_APHCR|nr:CCHC-type domain-containing protein [Aphis craccivora]